MIQNLPKIKHKDSPNFFLIAGPCAIENEDTPRRIVEKVIKITDELNIPYIFKGSFKKANRSRIDSFTGIGDEKALKIIRQIGEEFDVPTTTDIHESSHAEMRSEERRVGKE